MNNNIYYILIMNNNEKIYFLFIILILFCIILSNNNFFELFNLFDDVKLDIIISRYNEDLSFLKEKEFNNSDITIYNKGEELNGFDNIITLNNVGREGHTYLYHIVNNYDNLANVTCFFPGSCNDTIFQKRYKTHKVMELVRKTKDTVFLGGYGNGRDIYGFKLDTWESTNNQNKEKVQDHSLKRCYTQPFGEWHESNFPNVELKFLTWNGIFAVSKTHILQHSKEYYEKLLIQLSDSPNSECGHYFERAWVSVFHEIPENCLHIQ